jgi:two-component system response regulator AtoC
MSYTIEGMPQDRRARPGEPTVGSSQDEPPVSGDGETQWVLVVLRHGAIEEHTLPPRGELRVGRDDDVEISIGDRSVSRHHATIVIANGAVRVIDAGSRNGTTVGGRKVGKAPTEVVERETIVFGEVACHLMCTRRSEYRSDLRLEPDELDRRVVHEGERALRHDHSVSVLAIRLVDGEKQALDRALRAVSSNLRDLDVYASRQPTHLDVMLVETDRAGARLEAERVLAAITASGHDAKIGVATFPGDSPSPAMLAAAALMAANGAAAPGVHVAQDAIRVLRFGDKEVFVADRAMHRVFGLIERVAPTELSVLFCGETGTGKEVAASALHAFGPRKRHAMVAINCAALPENLLESELFGHERGAFSGAVSTKQGLFEQAHGGTIFLDEIGEMSPAIQAKLLRVLETKRIRRVGGVEERSVDVRVVAATHRDLDRQVQAGAFREDLLYRLRGLKIDLPPLRQRPHEIAILASRFLAETCRSAGRDPLPITAAATEVLQRYAWPGNIRELRHAMTSAAVLAEGTELTVEDLPETVRGATPLPIQKRDQVEDPSVLAADVPLDEAVRAYERERVERALTAAAGNQTQAARLLGIPRKTLVSKLKALGIKRDD